MNKMIFLDIDGTLLRDDGTYNKKIKGVIEEFKEINSYIVLTSARSRLKMEKIKNELGIDTYYISSNGSEIINIKTNNIIYSSYINDKSLLYIYSLAMKFNIELVLAVDDTEYIINNKNNINKNLLKKLKVKQIMMLSEDLRQLNKFIKKIDILDNVEFVYNLNNKENGKYWYSVVNKGVSKGNASLILSEHCNIKKENTIGIGNDYNDISMFNMLGLGVIVDNAINEVKEYASLIIDSNNNDGVYKYLKGFLKS